jgi:hypothetical protein
MCTECVKILRCVLVCTRMHARSQVFAPLVDHVGQSCQVLGRIPHLIVLAHVALFDHPPAYLLQQLLLQPRVIRHPEGTRVHDPSWFDHVRVHALMAGARLEALKNVACFQGADYEFTHAGSVHSPNVVQVSL